MQILRNNTPFARKLTDATPGPDDLLAWLCNECDQGAWGLIFFSIMIFIVSPWAD